MEGRETPADVLRAGAAGVQVVVAVGLPRFGLHLGHPGALALAGRRPPPAADHVGPVRSRPARRRQAEPVLVADVRIGVQAEDVTRSQRGKALPLGAVGVEAEQRAEVEPVPVGGGVHTHVEMPEGVHDDRPVVELLQGGDLLEQEVAADPPAMRARAVERLVFHLPGNQGWIQPVAVDHLTNESQGGVAEQDVLGDVLAVADAHRLVSGRDEEFRPAQSLHADRQDDGLARAIRLLHHPVELVGRGEVGLVPVGGEPDDPEMHRLQLQECRLVVEAESRRPQRAEAGAYLNGAGHDVRSRMSRPEHLAGD